MTILSIHPFTSLIPYSLYTVCYARLLLCILICCIFVLEFHLIVKQMFIILRNKWLYNAQRQKKKVIWFLLFGTHSNTKKTMTSLLVYSINLNRILQIFTTISMDNLQYDVPHQHLAITVEWHQGYIYTM